MSHGRRVRLGRLPRWQRVPSYVIFIACAISGVVYFLAHNLSLFLPPGGAHEVLMIHGIAAYAVVLAFGSLLPGHVRAAWNARRNRKTGVMMMAVLALLTMSGLALYYGSEAMRGASLWLHWGVGFALIALFPLHLVLGRRANARAANVTRLRHSVRPQVSSVSFGIANKDG